MWALIDAQLVSHGVKIDRAGLEGAACETYPAAALSAWSLGRKKQTWPELRESFRFLMADESLLRHFSSDDVCDAVVCALVARARDLGLTVKPPDEELAAARREGWIHVSCESCARLVGH